MGPHSLPVRVGRGWPHSLAIRPTEGHWQPLELAQLGASARRGGGGDGLERRVAGGPLLKAIPMGLFPGTFSCEKRMGGMQPSRYPNPPSPVLRLRDVQLWGAGGGGAGAQRRESANLFQKLQLAADPRDTGNASPGPPGGKRGQENS